jgi:phosphate starvation-inducible PhoH-like protein
MKNLRPKTEGQKNYLRTIQENKITFCIGPAGSGKTAIATRFAINEFLQQKYGRIIITRPLVQAGESTGYLPGDINNKMDPFVRPIYDELKLYIDCKQLRAYMEEGLIEIVPFAFMRGRNFHNAFILADESQNATFDQLKMLLTRLGRESKMVVNGDITQSDIPYRDRGALSMYAKELASVEGINSVYLTNEDIVREPVVADLLAVLEKLPIRP